MALSSAWRHFHPFGQKQPDSWQMWQIGEAAVLAKLDCRSGGSPRMKGSFRMLSGLLEQDKLCFYWISEIPPLLPEQMCGILVEKSDFYNVDLFAKRTYQVWKKIARKCPETPKVCEKYTKSWKHGKKYNGHKTWLCQFEGIHFFIFILNMS